jgi:hypothetical protein
MDIISPNQAYRHRQRRQFPRVLIALVAVLDDNYRPAVAVRHVDY